MTVRLYLTLLAMLALMISSAPARAADPVQPAATVEGHKGAVVNVAFTPDGKRLVSVDSNNVLKGWDVAAHKELYSFDGVASDRNPPKFMPDGKRMLLIGRDQASVLVVDVETGKPGKPIPVPDLHGGVTAIDLSADGKTLAVVGRGTLRILDAANGDVRFAWDVHVNNGIPGVALSPDGLHVATVGTDKTALVIEIATGKIPQTFELPRAGNMAFFTPDGKGLVVYSDDNVVWAFDALGGGDGKPLVEPGPAYKTMVPTADGKALVLAGPGRGPRVLPIPAGPLAGTAYDSPDFVFSAALSPDGKTLAGGTNDGKVHFWTVGG